jgi:hypothetical protein
MSNEPKLQELVALYAMISGMRVLSLARTVTCAEKITKATVDTYFAPNKRVRKVHTHLSDLAVIRLERRTDPDFPERRFGP